MLATLRRLITGTDQRTPAQVRGAQVLAGIDQKIRASQVALRAARSTLAGLVLQEKASLQQIEGLLQHMVAGQAGADPVVLRRAQTDLGGIAAHIGDLSAFMALTEARMAVLREAAIAARAVRPEHLAHCGLVQGLMGDAGPEVADRLMARLGRITGAAGGCALFGGAAKLQIQIG